MKAIQIDGKIKVYNPLPNSWKGVMGNFSKLSDEEIKAYGFYDVVTPDYNSKSQELSDIFWDVGNEVFTYTVNEKEWSQTLDELKQLKITSLKVNIQHKLNETDWYVIRKSERDIDIPSDITTERNNLFSKCETKETEINNLTTKKAVIEYDTFIKL
jgi:DNA repair exonuclease SbcCD nuclease subunit